MPDVTDVLPTKPTYLRAAKTSHGIGRIDRTGGYHKAGVIRDVAVITEGEALGHDFWIDSEFNEQVAEAINMRNQGIKSRFTHPGLSGDGLGRHLGRIMDARVEGGKVIADQHFAESAHNTPDGDLATYLMELADEDPEAYGLSIVFQHDEAATEAFTAAHTGGNGFVSPSTGNIANFPHARLAELRAADAVDEPAANPDGLFHREQTIAEDATAIAAYALNQTETTPVVACLGIDADRVKRFVADYLSTNNLEIRPMAEELETTVEEIEEVETPETAETAETAEAVEVEEAPQLSEAPTGADFLEAFGDQGGVWFAQGKSFEMCLALQNKALQEEVAALKQKATAPEETGENNPIDFNAEENAQARKGFASRIKIK